MAEPDPERQRHERDGEDRHRMAPAPPTTKPSDAEQASPAMNVGLSPSRLDDRPDEAALHDRAEHAEPGKTVARLRRIEGEPPRREQRERRLEHREGEPVDEIDHAARGRAAAAAAGRQIAKGSAGACLRAMNGFRQPEPGHRRRDERERRGGPDRRGVADLGEHAAQRGSEDETQPERGADEPVGARAIFRLGDVGDVRAGRRDVAAGQAVDDTAPRNSIVTLCASASITKLTTVPSETEDQDGPAAISIGQVAERRGGDQLADRERPRTAGR